MRFREKLALVVPPVLIRVVLGVTFLWAGLGKFSDMAVQGESAAILANMGVGVLVKAADQPPPIPEFDMPIEPLPEPESIPETPERPIEGGGQSSLGQGAIVLVQDEKRVYGADDFPNPVMVKRLYGLALMIDKAADPPLTEASEPQMALWPSGIGHGRWPLLAAWSATLTEVSAGLFLLFGFLTRISSLAIGVVMGVAIWLTTIGPAIQAGGARFGFLPAFDAFDIDAWTTPMWQFALFFCAIALLLLGPGPVSVDRALFRPARAAKDEPDDTKSEDEA